mmetsp:Transcript_2893/g.5119  ORF Transcript_2893/g.5119 Transcript_2893/m.5119 type:complete len:343 (+) Transcript_2893:426-1454(+)
MSNLSTAWMRSCHKMMPRRKARLSSRWQTDSALERCWRNKNAAEQRGQRRPRCGPGQLTPCGQASPLVGGTLRFLGPRRAAARPIVIVHQAEEVNHGSLLGRRLRQPMNRSHRSFYSFGRSRRRSCHRSLRSLRSLRRRKRLRNCQRSPVVDRRPRCTPSKGSLVQSQSLRTQRLQVVTRSQMPSMPSMLLKPLKRFHRNEGPRSWKQSMRLKRRRRKLRMQNSKLFQKVKSLMQVSTMEESPAKSSRSSRKSRCYRWKMSQSLAELWWSLKLKRLRCPAIIPASTWGTSKKLRSLKAEASTLTSGSWRLPPARQLLQVHQQQRRRRMRQRRRQRPRTSRRR